MARFEGGTMTLRAAAVLGQYVNVVLDANRDAALAGAGGKVIGITRHATSAVGDDVTVDLLSKPGNLRGIASAAIALNAYVSPAASGKWVTAGGATQFIAGTAAAADGDAFDIYHIP